MNHCLLHILVGKSVLSANHHVGVQQDTSPLKNSYCQVARFKIVLNSLKLDPLQLKTSDGVFFFQNPDSGLSPDFDGKNPDFLDPKYQP